jgi:hypothetical protein
MEEMKYKYKWVITNYVDKLKKNIIPLKADKLLFSNDIPVIKKGKYKGYMGISRMVLCMVIQK